MTTKQQFAFRGLVQHVLREKLEARKTDIDRKLQSLKLPPRSIDPIRGSIPQER